MASLNNIRARFQPQSSLAAASVTASYVAIGSLTHPSRMIMISNLTDGDLQFSFDGIHDNFPVAKRSAQVFDISSNQAQSKGLEIANLTTLYVKRIDTPTTGSVYFCSMYASDQ